MNAVEEWARTEGAEIALLDTYYGSPASVPFYRDRMGLLPTDTALTQAAYVATTDQLPDQGINFITATTR